MKASQNQGIFQFTSFYLLLAIETIGTGLYLLSLPRDPKNNLWLGYSLQRLVLVAVTVVALGGILTGLVRHLQRPDRAPEKYRRLLHASAFPWISSILAVLGMAGIVSLSFPRGWLAGNEVAYFERLYPLIFWLTLVSLECLLVLLGGRFSARTGWQPVLKSAGIALAVMLSLWLLIRWTGWGNTPDPVSWRQMGSPLLIWQICLAVAAGLGVYLLERHRNPIRWLDLALMATVYACALWMWLGQPLQNSYFSPEARPPNQEVYPYSDALYYSLAAESETSGNGLYGWTVTPRPFYLTVLSWIVALTGGKYAAIITVQSCLLAFIPVLLYLLGKRLAGRSVGLSVGLLAAFRELNAIQATHAIQLSHSKMIMADLPTLLAMLVLVLVTLRWLQDEENSSLWALLTGGCLGWVMLFRTQAVILLPFLLLLKWLQSPLLPVHSRAVHADWRRPLGAFALGLGLMLSPWLIRNYSLTGQIVFDDPNTQTGFLTGRYQLDDEASAGGSIVQAMWTHPGDVLQFVLNHFFRNVIALVFVTPPQGLVESIDSLVAGTNFWSADRVTLNGVQTVQLVALLAGMALGIAWLYRRERWMGLTPLVFLGAYTLGNALARNSGGRYNLPVDWVGYFYLAAGLVGTGSWLLRSMQSAGELIPMVPAETHPQPGSRRKTLVLAGLALLLVGSLIPLSERMFPSRYREIDADSIGALLQGWDIPPEQAAQISVNAETVVLYGRELYPRFYKPGDGEAGSNWVSYADLDFCRMGFVMVTSDGIRQALVMLDRPPANFPSRADALVIGKNASAQVKGRAIEYVQAEWIILRNEPPIVVQGLDSAPEKCRLQAKE